MKLDKTSAKVLAELIISDLRQYIAAHADEYAAFLTSEAEHEKDVPAKQRRSKKSKQSA